MAYLTLEEFKSRTTIPAEYVDAVEDIAPGWVTQQLLSKSRWLDSRLRKRYAVPFESPCPETILDWLTRIVTLRVWLRRGVDPSDEHFAEIRNDAERAEAEVLEAANSDAGLFDLPLRADMATSGVARGMPFGYSEHSPYVGFDLQEQIGRAEDRGGDGTYGGR